MRALLFFLIIFASGEILAQYRLPFVPYEPLQIMGSPSPNWYESMYYNKFETNTCDGRNFTFSYYNHVHPIIAGNYMYMSFGINPTGNHGFYVEKRNLQTGKIVWQNSVDRNDTEYEEVVKSMYINSEDNLEVIGYRANKKYKPETNLFRVYDSNCRFFKRVYNNENGNIIQFFTPELTDSITMKISGTDAQYSVYPNLFITEKPNEYLFIQNYEKDLFNPGTIQKVIYAKIDESGHPIVSVDTIILGEKPQVQNFVQISANRIAYINADRNKSTMTMLILDDDLKTIKEVVMDDFPEPISFMGTVRYEKEYVMMTNYTQMSNNFYRVGYGAYDYDGKLLDYILAPFNYYNDENTNAIYMPEYKKMAMVGSVSWRNNNIPSALHLLLTDGKGKIDDNFEWKLTGDSLRVGIGYDLVEKNGLLVLIITETRIDPNSPQLFFDSWASAKGYLAFNSADLGLIPVSTSDDLSIYSSFTLTPNPIYDHVTISLDKPSIGLIVVYSISGVPVMRFEIEGQLSAILDTTSLAAGMYYVSVYDDSKRVNTKKLIKL